jgi:hypothetical protein
MRMFSKAPVVTAETDAVVGAEKEVSALEKRRAELEQSGRDAAAARESAIIRRRDLLLAVEPLDPAALVAADVAVRNAEIAKAGVDDALVEIAKRLDIARQNLELVREQVARQREHERITAAVSQAERALAEFLAAAEGLGTALHNISFSTTSVAGVLRNFLRDIGGPLRQALDDANGYASSMRDGHVAIRRWPPAPEQAMPPAAEIERKTVFTVEALKWREGDMQKVGGKFATVQLPIALAELAIRHELAEEVDSPRAVKMRESHGPQYGTPPEACFDLMTDPPSRSAEADQVVVDPEVQRRRRLTSVA